MYQGAFSELDDDIGWTDFALRNYDAQIGRWVQQDPYQQFASPYVGMGDDPVNNTDPSGGLSWPPPGLGKVLTVAAESSGKVLEISGQAKQAISLLSKVSIAIHLAGKAVNIINKGISAVQVGHQIGGPADYIWVYGHVYRDPRVHSARDANTIWGRGVVYLGKETAVYYPKLEAQMYADENGNVGGKPIERIILASAFSRNVKLISLTAVGDAEVGLPAGLTTFYYVGGTYIGNPTSKIERNLIIKVKTESTATEDMGEPTYWGNVSVLQDGKTIFSQNLEKDESPESEKIIEYEEKHGEHNVGTTNLTLKRGETYQIVVNVKFSLNDAAGNHFVFPSSKTITINVTVK